MTNHTQPDLDWWYIRAYPGSSRSVDEAAGTVVPWLRERAEEAGAARWFFMRYLDMSGQHLRLRVQAPPAALDLLHTRIGEVEDLLFDLPAPVVASRLVPGAELGELPGVKMVRPAVFAPELQKYGGTEGAEISLDLFRTCSEWFDDNRIVDLPQSAERAALAVEHMQLLVTAALPEAQDRAEFWTGHRKQWGWQLRMMLPTREAYAARAQAVEEDLDRSPAPESNRSALAGLGASVVEALDRAERAQVRRTRIELLVEFLHMDMNRWGLMPAEECLIGLLAQSRPVRVGVDHRTNDLWKDAS